MRLVLILVLLGSLNAFPQEEITFSGLPKSKISESGLSRVVDKIAGVNAVKSKCIITEVNGKYFWTTRQNKEMIKIVSGAFVTFIAVDGSGYVRCVLAEMKSAVSSMGDTEIAFDYVEHLLLGLKSVTYYGVSQ